MRSISGGAGDGEGEGRGLRLRAEAGCREDMRQRRLCSSLGQALSENSATGTGLGDVLISDSDHRRGMRSALTKLYDIRKDKCIGLRLSSNV